MRREVNLLGRLLFLIFYLPYIKELCFTLLIFIVCSHIYFSFFKVRKLKVARRGLYSTAALYIADCAIAPNDVVLSFISRGATTLSDAGALY
jgi:hypothetical protein